jgi:bacterial/archaeal transporter family protein
VTWLAYALITVALWTGWSFFGALAMRSVSAAQATLVFAVATLLAGTAAFVFGGKASDWSPSALGLAVLSGACGAIGMITFYLALDRGKASNVVPVIGAYPALVTLLAVAFLAEKLSAVQAVGVGLAVLGVVLVGTGG